MINNAPIPDGATHDAQTDGSQQTMLVKADGAEIGTTLWTRQIMATTCLPAPSGGDISVPNDGAAHTLASAAANGDCFDLAVQPDLSDPSYYFAPPYRRVKIAARNAATRNSKWYSIADGTFRIGPLNTNEVISAFVPATEPAAVIVSLTKVT